MLLIYSLLIKNGRRIISSTELFVQLTVYSKWRTTQCCAEDSKESAEHTLKCGVPQGSILGPLFFIIFVNDMFNVSNVLFNVLCADDTCMYISGSEINALFDVINIELTALLEWLNANKLTLNVDKTFSMFFHGKRIKTDDLKLTIGQVHLNKHLSANI